MTVDETLFGMPKGKTYSEDLRHRVISAYEAGSATYEEVAERFDVSASFVRDLIRLRKETGGIERRARGGGMPRKLTPDDERALRRWCEARPDTTLREYQARLLEERGVEVSVMALSRALRRMGMTLKKRVSTPRSSGHRTSDYSEPVSRR